MGAAVAGLGAIAGGMAGNALAKKLNPAAPDGGGIPGLTTSKGSGKDGQGPGMAVQVDPGSVLAYYSQAANSQAAGYDRGLEMYLPYLKKATNEVNAGYSASNLSLAPLTFSAKSALNEQMRMLGLDPIQATYGYGDTIKTAYSKIAEKLPELEAPVKTLSTLFDKGTEIRDTAERAAFLSELPGKIKETTDSTLKALQNQLDTFRPPPRMPVWGGGLGDTPYSAYHDGGWVTAADGAYEYHGKMWRGPGADAGNAIFSQHAEANRLWRAEKAALKEKIELGKQYTGELQEFGEDFTLKYPTEFDKGYTGEQVAARVESLPGYQFALDTGTKAIERQGAANRMLGSANTALALQNYGEQNAMSFYGQYMNYLSGITAVGAPAMSQVATNEANRGLALAQIQEQTGQAYMDTERAKADFLAQSLMHSGDMLAQISMFNAAAQNTSIQNAKQQKNSTAQALGQQAIASGPAYMNAQTQRAGFLQGINNSVSAGQGYMAGFQSPQTNWNNMMRGYI